ncbi:MAG: glycosyltransferase [Coriobacteriales bacterium]|nr:glycosyltransferase [Coriobacteriales bacterium]
MPPAQQHTQQHTQQTPRQQARHATQQTPRQTTQQAAKPKIALLVSSSDVFSGALTVATNMANRMAEDYEVHLLYVYGKNQRGLIPLDPRVQTAAFLPEGYRFRDSAQKLFGPLRRYLAAHDIPLVFVHGVFSGVSALLVALLVRTTKFVYCDHSALRRVEGQEDSRLTLLRRMIIWTYRAIVTLTRQNKGYYREYFGVEESKLFVIGNWVSPELLERPVHYASDSKRILWAGRLSHEKGIDHLLAIAKLVLPSHPDWVWDVYGDGELSTQLAADIEACGLTGQLCLRGYESNLARVYDSAAILTLTSRTEGLPMVLLEGKARGLPLIAFDIITGPSEIIADGVDGSLVPPYDHDAFAERLSALMDDPALRASFSAHARDTIHRFDHETIYAQWRALIEYLS